jgi:hypothetical protein
MKMHNQNDDDVIREFLNPEMIEKAPEGFTSKTMTRIQIETQTERAKYGFIIRNRVPLITALITAGLIIAAIFIPANENDSIGSAIWKFFQGIEFNLPSINNSYYNILHLPGWIIYAVFAGFLLVFFDEAFSGIFHREKE